MRPLLRFSLALVPLALAGCSSRSGDLGSTGGIFNPGISSSLDSRHDGDLVKTGRPALASLAPEAGRIVVVREREYANGITQEIVLAGDSGTRGENRIDIALRTEQAGERYDNLVPIQRPASEDIEAEMQERFPGIDMRAENFVTRNAYGGYGVATGRSGRMNCAYYWQHVTDLDRPGQRPGILKTPTEASIRVRLCRTDLTREAMLEIVRAIHLGPAQGGPGAAPAIDKNDLLSETTAPLPRGISSRRAIAARFDGYDTPPVAQAPAARSERVAVSTASSAAVAAATRYEAAPAPDRAEPVRQVARRSGARKQRVARVRARPVQQETPAVMRPAVMPQQAYVPQGLAPQPPGSAGYGAYAAGPAPVAAQPYVQPGQAPAYSAAAVQRRLDPSLPPQAYAGPQGAAAGGARNRPAYSPY